MDSGRIEGGKTTFILLGNSLMGIKSKRNPLYLAFLDIEKAYDKVNRKKVIYISR